jgi:hypothetical protein
MFFEATKLNYFFIIANENRDNLASSGDKGEMPFHPSI